MSRYVMPEPDIDVPLKPIDHGPANACLMCGATTTALVWGACALEDGRDSLGPKWRYVSGYRCAEPLACRARRQGLHVHDWQFSIHDAMEWCSCGEDRPTLDEAALDREMAVPMDPPLPIPPVAEEAPRK